MVTNLRKNLAHVLSWVRTYHHAKFQRNPLIGLTRMMVQTYRQTHRQTDISFHIYIYISRLKFIGTV